MISAIRTTTKRVLYHYAALFLVVKPFQSLFTRTGKPWKRFLSDAGFKYVTSRLSVRQIQYLLGDSLEVYRKWIAKTKLEEVVDEIGDGARLLWIGKRNTDKVILYLHGM